MKIFLAFSSKYLCEAGFFGMARLKTKTRNTLDVTNSLHLDLTTSVEPRIDKIVKTKTKTLTLSLIFTIIKLILYGNIGIPVM